MPYLLQDNFDPTLEHPKYKLGSVVAIAWGDEVAWARVIGFDGRAGELVYKVKLWTLGDMEYENREEVGLETWIFPDMIIKVN